jgi:hypothetical protein
LSSRSWTNLLQAVRGGARRGAAVRFPCVSPVASAPRSGRRGATTAPFTVKTSQRPDDLAGAGNKQHRSHGDNRAAATVWRSHGPRPGTSTGSFLERTSLVATAPGPGTAHRPRSSDRTTALYRRRPRHPDRPGNEPARADAADLVTVVGTDGGYPPTWGTALTPGQCRGHFGRCPGRPYAQAFAALAYSPKSLRVPENLYLGC